MKFSTAYDKQASSTCDAPAMMLGLVTCVPAPSASICHSQLDRTLKCRWEEAVEAGLCRYRLERVQNRVLPGKFGFVAQVLYIYIILPNRNNITTQTESFERFSTIRKSPNPDGGDRVRICAKSTPLSTLCSLTSIKSIRRRC